MSKQTTRNGSIEAMVLGVYNSVRGRYAAAKSDILEGSITFGLDRWEGESEPTPGEMVKLDDIRRFERGWRAYRASRILLT